MKLGIYEQSTKFINNDCLRMIKGEVVGIIFLIICGYILFTALFSSDKNLVFINSIGFSMYYIFPIIIVSAAIVYLLFKFIKNYRKVVFNFYYRDGLVLNILGIFNKKLMIYNVHDQEYLIGYLDGFKKKYHKCICIEANKRIYLIPFKPEMKASLLEELDKYKN